MARLNDDAQWIVLMGFLVSFSLFFLAMIINQSTVVGQTTAESVIEFPKNDIRDVRYVITHNTTISSEQVVNGDIVAITMSRKNAVVYYKFPPDTCFSEYLCMPIHYKDGVTEYDENWVSP